MGNSCFHIETILWFLFLFGKEMFLTNYELYFVYLFYEFCRKLLIPVIQFLSWKWNIYPLSYLIMPYKS